MADSPHRRMKRQLDSIEKDPEYQWLRSCRDAMEAQVTAICKEVSREDRETLLEYWGISQEMMIRSVEIACFMDEE